MYIFLKLYCHKLARNTVHFVFLLKLYSNISLRVMDIFKYIFRKKLAFYVSS